MFIVDAHLDLSMNALEWNRDLRMPVSKINEREKGQTDKPDRSRATVSVPALRKGNTGIVVATQIARYVEPQNPLPGWFSPHQAWAQTQGQLAWYKAMEEAGEMFAITDNKTLETHLEIWSTAESTAELPIGYILSLEGADSLIDLNYLDKAWAYGLRAIGPAHYGPGRYANGTDSAGKMGAMGLALLSRMEELGMILDLTHLNDDAFWQALAHFKGAVWASHNNCRKLVNHNRQFSDDQLKAIIERNGVIGGALDAWMLVPDWVRGKSTPSSTGCTLKTVARHMDHICQLAGNANHVGIGSDLDGGFGKEQCPEDLGTIADIQLLPEIFKQMGYSTSDLDDIFHGNWIKLLRHSLPQ